jgi:vacuolar-type H+-ATPase subunit B/Vma2
VKKDILVVHPLTLSEGKQPSELIPTGIAGIDLNNTLVFRSEDTFFC